jgi:DNA-binding HxlR family transcriptional regulator
MELSLARVIVFCNWLQNIQTDGRMQVVSGDTAMKKANGSDQRSGCPINLTLEVVGDKWSLLIIRDIIFGNHRHFRELLTKSEEGIASNILADRLKRLTEQGIVSKADDPTHKQKAIYSLTEKGIELLPILAQMAVWGRKYLPVTEELSIRAQLLEEGGPKLWAEFMEELREIHLGVKRKKKAGPSVGEKLQAAYQAVVAKRAARS